MPQGAHRVKNETDKTSNSDANNSNNDSVTSYSDSISYDEFIFSLSLSSSAPHQHEIACASKSCLVDEVYISYKYQFILDNVATKHMSGILNMFTSIK